MRHRSILILLFATVCFAAWRCTVLMPEGISMGDEALTALRSLGLRDQGRFWTPYWNGEPDLHKPPLYYFLCAAGYSIIGVNEAALRLPSVFAYLYLIMLVWVLGKNFFDDRTGLLAAVLTALHPTLAAQSCAGMMDTLMIAFSLTAVYALWRSSERPRWLYLWGICCGLALLTKGEAATPVLVVSAIYLGIFRRDLVRSMFFYRSLAIAIILPGVWFGSQFVMHRDLFLKPHYQDFVDYRFKHSWRDTALYLKSSRYLWYSWGSLAPFMIAAVFYTVAAIAGFVPVDNSSGKGDGKIQRKKLVLILLAGLVPMLMASIVRQQKYWYMLPAIAPMSLLASHCLLESLRHRGRVKVWLLILTLSLVAGVWLPHVKTADPLSKAISSLLFLLGTALYLLLKGRQRLAGIGLLGIGLLCSVVTGLATSNRQINLSRPLSPTVSRMIAERVSLADMPPGRLIVNFRHYPLNSLMFYAGRHSVQLRAFSNSTVEPGAEFTVILARGMGRDFLQGLTVEHVETIAGYEIITVRNSTDKSVIPARQKVLL